MHIGRVLIVAGVASHAGFFNRGEHHMHGIRYLQIYFGFVTTALVALASIGEPLGKAFSIVITLTGYYLVGLYGSVIIYRIFFSPLKHFPGPLWAKVSSLGFSVQLWKGNSHKRLLALHQKYGDFVRIGSSDLSITHPKAVQAIYGRGSKCVKADWYDLTLPMISMQTTRKRTEHDARRRVWAGAFSDAMLRGYEGRMTGYQDQLIAHIKNAGQKPLDVSELFNLYSYDVMGDLAFGASFNMIQNNEQHWAIKLLHRGMKPLGLMLPAWCFRTLLAIPGATGDWFAFKDYCCQSLEARMNTKVETPNIMSFLLDPWKDKKPTGSDLNMLQGDSQLIVVAGSDTTATTLASVFYELAKLPDGVSRVRNEIRSLLESGEPLSNQKLQSLELLNGVISETLRLHPPSGLLQRKTPPEGLVIGETHVPGNMTVLCPQYVAGRNEEIYTCANDFRPERWYERPEMVKEPSAYSPFSTGAYNCIGKGLALLNLRTTIAKLVLNFVISFAEGETGAAFEENARTQFTTHAGELNLKFVELEM